MSSENLIQKYSITKAIQESTWLNCKVFDFDYYGEIIGVNSQFRIRIHRFWKVNLNDVDEPNEIENINDEGDYWVVDVDIINLNKEEFRYTHLEECLLLSDQDECIFKMEKDSHMCCHSDYAKTSGLDTGYAAHYRPKIKKSVKLPYFLPKLDDQEYYIHIKNGEIKEV
ncbi:hypothetical protein [Methanospirillum sp.]